MSRRIYVMVVLVCVACSRETQQERPTTSTSSATDADAIRQIYPAFVAAKLARDVERELSFVTDDAVYAPPGMPDVAGKAARRNCRCRRPCVFARNLDVAFSKSSHGTD